MRGWDGMGCGGITWIPAPPLPPARWDRGGDKQGGRGSVTETATAARERGANSSMDDGPRGTPRPHAVLSNFTIWKKVHSPGPSARRLAFLFICFD